MALRHVQKTYEELGKSDPLFAVLSFEHGRNNKWDTDEFFARGRREISDVLQKVAALGLEVNRNRAMDFGCGVGRLTQALCDGFVEVVGVDISSSMVQAANSFNKHGDRCSYRVNTSSDLAQFEDSCFDFIYSNITLQHIPPEASKQYIAEFFRLLRPGGVAVFQIPSGPRHDPGTLGAWFYSLQRGPLRRLWKRIRGKPPVEIHYVNQDLVEEIISGAGGRLIETRQDGSVRRSRVSIFYTAWKQK